MFVSCSNVSCLEDENLENEKSTYKVSDFIDLKVVAFSLYETVYVDNNTGILYYRKNVKNGGSGGLFHSQGIVSMVVAYTVFTVAWLAVWQWNVRKLIGVTFVEALSDVLPFMLAAAAVMTTTYFVTSAIADPRLLLPVRIFVAASLYFVVMKVAKVKILEECIAYFRK